MDRYPIFLDLHARSCLVVGGGKVAERKVDQLLKAGAHLTLVAPQLSEEMRLLISQYSVNYQARAFADQDIEGHFLAIAATNNRQVNAHIAALANARHIPVNVVDDQALCSFTVPSIIDRSPVMVAVSTGGASPVLARQLRMRLETMISSHCGELAGITEEYRDIVKARLPENQRKTFWEQALRGPFAELVYAGQIEEARQYLAHLLSNYPQSQAMGEVYLVGAGPGDPDLLTFKALRLMQQADVVVYDRLVAKSILDMSNPEAARIYVGKEKANHAVPQDKINDLLVELAQQGKRVLRLKGGDPFIFGRGGEEIETLAENNVPFQVVPGITAASGCASYAGIPLTHRDYAQSCTFATGHLKDSTIDLNWTQLAQVNQTVVFYMGLTGIDIISQKLQEYGRSGDTPAALIEQGTTRNQRVHIGTLATLPQLVKSSGARAPTLTIIGEVVNLHAKLHWYEPQRHVIASEFSRNPASAIPKE